MRRSVSAGLRPRSMPPRCSLPTRCHIPPLSTATGASISARAGWRSCTRRADATAIGWCRSWRRYGITRWRTGCGRTGSARRRSARMLCCGTSRRIWRSTTICLRGWRIRRLGMSRLLCCRASSSCPMVRWRSGTISGCWRSVNPPSPQPSPPLLRGERAQGVGGFNNTKPHPRRAKGVGGFNNTKPHPRRAQGAGGFNRRNRATGVDRRSNPLLQVPPVNRGNRATPLPPRVRGGLGRGRRRLPPLNRSSNPLLQIPPVGGGTEGAWFPSRSGGDLKEGGKGFRG
jgi:hypothetical protein